MLIPSSSPPSPSPILVLRRFGYRATPARQINPLVLAVGGFIGRVGALVAGRRARQAYQKMDPQQKKAYRQLLLQRFGMLGALFAAYYAAHLNRAPVTGRWRVLFLSHEEQQLLDERTVDDRLVTRRALRRSHARPYDAAGVDGRAGGRLGCCVVEA